MTNLIYIPNCSDELFEKYKEKIEIIKPNLQNIEGIITESIEYDNHKTNRYIIDYLIEIFNIKYIILKTNKITNFYNYGTIVNLRGGYAFGTPNKNIIMFKSNKDIREKCGISFCRKSIYENYENDNNKYYYAHEIFVYQTSINLNELIFDKCKFNNLKIKLIYHDNNECIDKFIHDERIKRMKEREKIKEEERKMKDEERKMKEEEQKKREQEEREKLKLEMLIQERREREEREKERIKKEKEEQERRERLKKRQQEMRTVIYKSYFDPISFRHKTIINKLYEEFDQVIIIVDNTPYYKECVMFDISTRIDFIKKFIKHNKYNNEYIDKNIKVISSGEMKNVNFITFLKNKYNLNDNIYQCMRGKKYLKCNGITNFELEDKMIILKYNIKHKSSTFIDYDTNIYSTFKLNKITENMNSKKIKENIKNMINWF